MKSAKALKRALGTSIIAIVLSIVMLTGTTLAWFTDSVASGSNVITSGNLDIEVEYTLDGENWNNLDGADDLFQKGLWEPGHTEVVVLKVENKGSLAVKYNANMNIVDETSGKTKDGDEIKLSEVLTVSTLTIEAAGADPVLGWDIAAMTLEKAFQGENDIGWGTPVAFNAGNILESDQSLLVDSTQYVFVKVDMPETVGNEANHNGTDIPTIDFGVNVLATQYTYENDSFGNQYDKDAQYAAELSKGEESEDGVTFNLTGDVILTDEPLYSDVTTDKPVTINGNGYTVVGEVSSIDEFTWIDNTIPVMSNIFSSADGAKVTVNDITFTGTMSAVMAGNYVNNKSDWFNTEFNNVNIVDAKVVSFSGGVSPALAIYGKATLNNCNINGTTLSELDTDPRWPVYDIIAVNNTDTIINGGKVGTIYTWAKTKLTINNADIGEIVTNSEYRSDFQNSILEIGEGTTVGKITVTKDANAANIVIKAGATVDIIDFSALAGNTVDVKLTVEDGAVVTDYIEYNTIND